MWGWPVSKRGTGGGSRWSRQPVSYCTGGYRPLYI